MGPSTLDAVRRALAAVAPARLPQPLPRRSAVALVLREGGPGLEALLIRRAERAGDPWSGHMAFPGGRADPEEPLVATAVRETAEEVGLDLAREATLLGRLDEIQAVGRGRALGLSIQPFVFGLESEPGPLRLSGEVARAHWLPVRALLDPANLAPFPYEHEGVVLELPSQRVGDLVIWGLTFRMLQAFAEVVGAAPVAR